MTRAIWEGSSLDSCRACLRGLEGRARLLPVLGGALGAAVGSSRCPSRSRPLCFPGPAWFRQLGTAGPACSSGGEPCGECAPGVAVGQVMGLEEPRAGKVSFSRGLGISSSHPLPALGQGVTLDSLHFAECDTHRCSASEREQLVILSAPQPTTAHRQHGHGDRVELPHLR